MMHRIQFGSIGFVCSILGVIGCHETGGSFDLRFINSTGQELHDVRLETPEGEIRVGIMSPNSSAELVTFAPLSDKVQLVYALQKDDHSAVIRVDLPKPKQEYFGRCVLVTVRNDGSVDLSVSDDSN